jgi:hypothetical protein
MHCHMIFKVTTFEQFCCLQLTSTKVNYSHVTLLNGNAINYSHVTLLNGNAINYSHVTLLNGNAINKVM